MGRYGAYPLTDWRENCSADARIGQMITPDQIEIEWTSEDARNRFSGDEVTYGGNSQVLKAGTDSIPGIYVAVGFLTNIANVSINGDSISDFNGTPINSNPNATWGGSLVQLTGATSLRANAQFSPGSVQCNTPECFAGSGYQSVGGCDVVFNDHDLYSNTYISNPVRIAINVDNTSACSCIQDA